MAASAIHSFSGKKLQPSQNPDLARTRAVSLVPGTYYAGQVLGQFTGIAGNDVDTITVDACTHSTLTIANLPDGSSYAAAQDITPAALATALNAQLGAGSCTVTGTYVAGSGGTYIITWTGPYADTPIAAITVTATFVGGIAPAVANVHTAGVANGAFGAYAHGNSDGTQVPQCILAWPCKVDDEGRISGIGQWDNIQENAVAFNRGQFFIADLYNYDASNTLTDSNGWRKLDAAQIELP